MKAYLFDIDGTLTFSRQKMDSNHTMHFLTWMSHKHVYLVTGSDIDKTRQQVPHSILRKCDGIFSSMGNVLHIEDEIIYKNEFTLRDDIKNSLDDVLATTSCPRDCIATKHYELRPGMINFSICGRDVTKKQRKKYNEWDNENKERADIVEWFNNVYKKAGVEACLGGEISIDIQPIGKDKRQSVEYLIDNGYSEFTFFGDRAAPGGNDWGVCEYILEHDIGSYYSVNNPNETLAILNSLD